MLTCVPFFKTSYGLTSLRGRYWSIGLYRVLAAICIFTPSHVILVKDSLTDNNNFNPRTHKREGVGGCQPLPPRFFSDFFFRIIYQHLPFSVVIRSSRRHTLITFDENRLLR